MPTTTDAELSVDDDEAIDDIDCLAEDFAQPETSDDGEAALPPKQRISAPRRAMLFGLTVVIALACLVGWLGLRVHHTHQVQAQRNLLLQVARQGALNLTTIDWESAE